MEKWLYFAAIIIFLFALYAYAGEAAVTDNVAAVSLDSETLQKGYTVKSNDDFFWLPILPKQFTADDFDGQALRIKIEKVDIASMILPDGVTRVSSAYSYDIGEDEAILIKPVLLSLKYFSDNEMTDRAVYLFHDGDWEMLDTKLLEKDHLARAQTCHSHGMVMVAEQQNIHLTARAAIVIDDTTGQILFSKNEDGQQAVASMTKIMTALVFIDNNPGWKKMVQIQKSDNVGGTELNIKVGDKLSVKDIFFATLVGSKNNMAMALARSTGLSAPEFVAAMNKKALEFAATNTKFVEPTGLDSANVSTADDMAKIMRQAFKSPKMLEATTLKNYWVKTAAGKKYLVTNTNKLLSTDLYITGGKTGHTEEAGYCLGTKARLNGREILAVVLGATAERNYKEVYYLLKKFAS